MNELVLSKHQFLLMVLQCRGKGNVAQVTLSQTVATTIQITNKATTVDTVYKLGYYEKNI